MNKCGVTMPEKRFTGVLQEGEPSYPLYAKERAELLASLKRRAVKLHRTLSALQGVTCTEPEGALYAMPQIRLPNGAIEVGRQAACDDLVRCCHPLGHGQWARMCLDFQLSLVGLMVELWWSKGCI